MLSLPPFQLQLWCSGACAGTPRKSSQQIAKRGLPRWIEECSSSGSLQVRLAFGLLASCLALEISFP